jgi:hypothetical protein
MKWESVPDCNPSGAELVMAYLGLSPSADYPMTTTVLDPQGLQEVAHALFLHPVCLAYILAFLKE